MTPETFERITRFLEYLRKKPVVTDDDWSHLECLLWFQVEEAA